MQTKAIIFDLDGVLTDTSDVTITGPGKNWLTTRVSLLLTRKMMRISEVSGGENSLMYIIRNRKNQYSEQQIQEMMERKNKYYTDMIKEMGPGDLVSGGCELLMEIKQAGIKIAIASASKNCREVLQHLQIIDLFDGIADGYCIVNGKPAPDVFVFAAGLVNVPTPDCLGIEDADAGIEAIKNAGMQALGIGPEERFHRADKVLPNLENAHLNDLLIPQPKPVNI